MLEDDDRYITMIRETRAPIRADAIISIVNMLVEADFLDSLEMQITVDAEVRDDPYTVVPLIEGHIAKLYRRYTGTMGIALDVQGIYRHPHFAFLLMDMILNAIDDHSAVDELLPMALSGEPPVLVLENMARYIYGEPGIHFEEIIEHIEPRMMRAITNILSARSMEEATTILDMGRTNRLVAFVRTFPADIDADLFFEAPITTSEDALISMFPKEHGEEDTFLVAHAVGMAVFYHPDFATAYEKLEYYMDVLNTEGRPTREILELAAGHLKEIYGANEDAQERVPDNSL